MKTIKFLLVMLFSIAVTACGGGGGSSTPTCASVPGVALLNVGSTAGGVSYAIFGNSGISFDNTNLNFSAYSRSTSIADAGTGCFASITTLPTNGQSTVAMVVGHNYVIDGTGGTYYKFSADSYSQGTVHISWIQMFIATATTTAQSLGIGLAMTSFSPLTPSGGATPYTYSYTGTLPAGLSFDTSTGAVTGTPTATYGPANLVFSVKDANNVVASTTSTVSFVSAVPAYVVQGGLTWMPVTFSDTWANANAYCANTAINGQTGWRMPTQAELSALYASGAMNGQGGWTLDLTWSSTVASAGFHYDIRLNTGLVGWGGDAGIVHVSCVR